jgi:hypothetical protein
MHRFDPTDPFGAIQQPYFNRIASAAPKHIKYMPGPTAAKTVSPIGLPIAICKYQQIHFT